MSLSAPHLIQHRLEEIDRDLAERQNVLEESALDWFRAKRDKEHAEAVAFMSAEGTVAERRAVASKKASGVGKDAEARYEACKAVVRVLETRANIGMALLKSQGRA